MKYILPIFLLSIMQYVVMAQQPFTIQGHIKGLKDGTIIHLMKHEGSVGTQIATDTVHNEKFTFSGNIPENETGRFRISCYDNEGFPPTNLELFATAGSSIHVSGRDNLLKTWTVRSSVPEQKEWDRFINVNKSEWVKLQQLWVERARFTKDVDKGPKEIYDNKQDSINKLGKSIQKKIVQQEIKLLSRSVMSPIAMLFLKGAALHVKYNPDERIHADIARLYNRLNSEQKNTDVGEYISILLNPPAVVKIGEQMADADLVDTSGNHHRLANYSGKFILLDFWGFGCGPCEKAIPEMKELSHKYSDSLVIVSITLDARITWLKATNYFDVPWKNLSDGKENMGLAARYGVSGIPHYALISPDGKLVSSWTGYGTGMLKEKLKEYIFD